MDTGEKLVEQLLIHAQNRDIVQQERDKLNQLVKENASCPACYKNTQLKIVGVEKSEEGWKSNKYKCRKCNITFVWNAPNNPWDMIPYVERFIEMSSAKAMNEHLPVEEKQQILQAMEQMKQNLGKLKPVVEASDKDLEVVMNRDQEMDELIHKFKKYLLIEKIKLDD